MCQTGGQVVDTVLAHAEACLKRGEYRMAATALRSAIQQHKPILLADEKLLSRAVSLKEKLIEVRHGMAEPNHVLPTNNYNGRPPLCSVCKGTRKFGNLGKCIACKGKGFQTKEDMERNMNYWKQRQMKAAANEQRYACALKEWL